MNIDDSQKKKRPFNGTALLSLCRLLVLSGQNNSELFHAHATRVVANDGIGVEYAVTV